MSGKYVINIMYLGSPIITHEFINCTSFDNTTQEHKINTNTTKISYTDYINFGSITTVSIFSIPSAIFQEVE